jgi:triosephosphate isomerase
MARKDSRLIVFNWKENPQTEREAFRLVAAIIRAAREEKRGKVEIVACPPVVYLKELSKKIVALGGHFSLGAQDVFWEVGGPHTGEIGPTMLRNAGKNVRYVIIGHSERRRWLGETDEMVNKKVRAALAAGRRVVLCVGEPLSVRKKGDMASRRCVERQLLSALRGIGELGSKAKNLIVTYEPPWAISNGSGVGDNAGPAAACAMSDYIRKVLRASRHLSRATVIYGGSVNSRNVADYIQYKEINGVLVGGASLRVEEIRKIIKKFHSYGEKGHFAFRCQK